MSIIPFDVEFTRDGQIFDQAQADAAIAGAVQLTDLFVLAHGWNNNREEAAALFDELSGNIERLLRTSLMKTISERKFGAVRVFWPSKRFEDADLIPAGGAASAGGQPDLDALIHLLDALKHNPVRLGDTAPDPVRVPVVDKLKDLVPMLDTDAAARREFVLHLRALVDATQANADDGSAEFFAEDPLDMFTRLSKPVSAPAGPATRGGAADFNAIGSAAGLHDLFSGFISAARRLANYTTYCEMKQRAGVVGSTGVAQFLMLLREKNRTLRLHLAGHSFGGRLVTAAANALPPNTNAVSITLLQAAYSHNGIGLNFDGQNHDGAFRRLVAEKRASGPILITHTKNDQAVGVAYPLASRITNEQAAAFGDQNDPYGGMGRNGAQHTPEVNAEFNTLVAVGQPYAFSQGAVYNLRADDFIHDHGDVRGEQVAYAMLNAVKAIQ